METHSQDTALTTTRKLLAPSPAQLHSACLAYRHDYGVMDEHAREPLRTTALEWFKVWQKEGFIPSE